MKKIKNVTFILIIALSKITYAQQNNVLRKQLASLILNQHVCKADIQEITLAAGQSAPKHLHPCPVIGVVKSGKVLFQVKGDKKIVLKAGDSFYEPKNTEILHFDNLLMLEPTTFIAVYLKEKEEKSTILLN